MGYGDFQFYDIVIFGAVAVFLVFRLRKVLGRRTGFEKNHQGVQFHPHLDSLLSTSVLFCHSVRQQ